MSEPGTIRLLDRPKEPGERQRIYDEANEAYRKVNEIIHAETYRFAEPVHRAIDALFLAPGRWLLGMYDDDGDTERDPVLTPGSRLSDAVSDVHEAATALAEIPRREIAGRIMAWAQVRADRRYGGLRTALLSIRQSVAEEVTVTLGDWKVTVTLGDWKESALYSTVEIPEARS